MVTFIAHVQNKGGRPSPRYDWHWVIDGRDVAGSWSPPLGEQEERTVTLGLNDGVNIEVTSGLTEGETILQFVPGAAAGGGDGGVIIDPGVDPGFTDGGGVVTK